MSVTGVVKSFNPEKGWGFIADPDGVDYFLHMANVAAGVPQKDEQLTFEPDKDEKKGKPIAKNVSGCSVGTSCSGVVKSYGSTKGFGFVACGEQDVFIHVSNVRGGEPQVGDTIYFDMEADAQKPDKMIAKDITGGSGSHPKPKEEKGGWDKGGWDKGGWDKGGWDKGGWDKGGWGQQSKGSWGPPQNTGKGWGNDAGKGGWAPQNGGGKGCWGPPAAQSWGPPATQSYGKAQQSWGGDKGGWSDPYGKGGGGKGGGPKGKW